MRSSFPEAEVTRSLSSNLLKKGFTKLSEDDARVIDTNELVAKRIRELSAKMPKESNTGFVSGLAADTVDRSGGRENRIHSFRQCDQSRRRYSEA